MTSVEEEIQDNQISHRFCKRMVTKVTKKVSSYIRVITGDENSFKKINERIFFKHKHYVVYPDDPSPIPCNRFFQYTCTRNNCALS